MRLDLDWSDHKSWLENTELYPLWRSLKLGSFSLEQTTCTYKELMLSIISYTTKFYAVDVSFINYWNKLFFQVLKRCRNISPGRLSQHAFYHYLQTFHLDHFICCNYISNHFIHLNIMNKLWHKSTRVTLSEHPELLDYNKFSRTEPLSNINVYLNRHKIHLFRNPNYDGDPHSQFDRSDIPNFVPRRQFTRPLDQLCATYYNPNFDEFIDSANDQTRWLTCILYRTDAPGYAIARGGFCANSFFDDVRAYAGELCAATAGYISIGFVGETAVNYTDCNSMIQAVRSYTESTPRYQIRSAGRPFLRQIARARKEFPTRSVQLHVRAHQDNSTDVRHTRNHIADTHSFWDVKKQNATTAELIFGTLTFLMFCL